MAGRKPIDIWEYFTKIQPYLQRGCTVHEACLEAKVPYNTVNDYLNKWDELSGELRDAITQAQNIPIVMARKVWLSKIQEGDYQASRDYLKAKRKEEFSERSEVNNTGNLKLEITEEDKAHMDRLLDSL